MVEHPTARRASEVGARELRAGTICMPKAQPTVSFRNPLAEISVSTTIGVSEYSAPDAGDEGESVGSDFDIDVFFAPIPDEYFGATMKSDDGPDYVPALASVHVDEGHMISIIEDTCRTGVIMDAGVILGNQRVEEEIAVLRKERPDTASRLHSLNVEIKGRRGFSTESIQLAQDFLGVVENIQQLSNTRRSQAVTPEVAQVTTRLKHAAVMAIACHMNAESALRTRIRQVATEGGEGGDPIKMYQTSLATHIQRLRKVERPSMMNIRGMGNPT